MRATVLPLTRFAVAFSFYSVRRVYILSKTIQIEFMTFVIQQINKIKDQITTFHWCFWPIDSKRSLITSSALS